MLKIKHSNKFKKDYAQYKRDIEKISNERVKKECYTLLHKLVEEFNYIDAVHDLTNKTIDPTRVRENVERSANIRLRLNKIIKDSKS
jgi:mRNA-degrading endonuclease YafQ of YafQ-DinJ toxin-antitoxin module